MKKIAAALLLTSTVATSGVAFAETMVEEESFTPANIKVVVKYDDKFTHEFVVTNLDDDGASIYETLEGPGGYEIGVKVMAYTDLLQFDYTTALTDMVTSSIDGSRNEVSNAAGSFVLEPNNSMQIILKDDRALQISAYIL